jgi:hypothetical protein
MVKSAIIAGQQELLLFSTDDTGQRTSSMDRTELHLTDLVETAIETRTVDLERHPLSQIFGDRDEKCAFACCRSCDCS